MHQLIGEYECTMDAKGRVRMPTNLLKQLNNQGAFNFVVNRGYENHLMLYPHDVWEEKTKELNHLDFNNLTNRQAIRYFYRGAAIISTDSSERILIPRRLITYAGLEKKVTLFAYRDLIEIWDSKSYEAQLESEPDNFSELAQALYLAKQKVKTEDE